MNKLDNDFEEVGNEDEVLETTTEASADNQLTTFGIDLNSLTDETITDEMIRELDLMGVRKPAQISWVRWYAVGTESVLHTHMIHLRIAGMTYVEIATELGYSVQQVMIVLRSPIIKAKVDAKMEEIYGKDFKKAFTNRAAKAIAVYDEILEDKTVRPQVRLAAAQHIMDHTVGKPQQTVEHKGSLLAEFIAKADQLHEVNNQYNNLQKETTAFDNLLKEIVPEGITVGKRGSNEVESK